MGKQVIAQKTAYRYLLALFIPFCLYVRRCIFWECLQCLSLRTHSFILCHSLCLPRRVRSVWHLAQALSLLPREARAFKGKHSPSSLSPQCLVHSGVQLLCWPEQSAPEHRVELEPRDLSSPPPCVPLTLIREAGTVVASWVCCLTAA